MSGGHRAGLFGLTVGIVLGVCGVPSFTGEWWLALVGLNAAHVLLGDRPKVQP